MENIDRIRKLAGLNEKAGDGGLPPGWQFSRTSPDGVPIEDYPDRVFTGRLPYDSPDNGYFPPQENPNGTWSQKHKKWPQYDLVSTDGGKTFFGNWTGTTQGAAENDLPNTKNNGWMAQIDLTDADETTNGVLMPPDLVDMAGMRSKDKSLGYSLSPKMQADRAMQFAKQMGIKGWDPSWGFDVVAGYIPYALSLTPGVQFNKPEPDKSVRVPVNLFTPEERASIAQARWSGSQTPSITIGGYSMFNPGAKKFKDSPDDEDDTGDGGGDSASPAAQGGSDADDSAGGVHAANAAPGTSLARIKPIPFDPKVKVMQKAILAKDPNALPRFHDDGTLGPETAAAMAKYPDIADLYIKTLMTTGKTIGDTYRELTAGKAPTNEGDNVATFEEAAYDHELARIKSLSLLR
jgi:hypothetical protein